MQIFSTFFFFKLISLTVIIIPHFESEYRPKCKKFVLSLTVTSVSYFEFEYRPDLKIHESLKCDLI